MLDEQPGRRRVEDELADHDIGPEQEPREEEDEAGLDVPPDQGSS